MRCPGGVCQLFNYFFYHTVCLQLNQTGTTHLMLVPDPVVYMCEWVLDMKLDVLLIFFLLLFYYEWHMIPPPVYFVQ